MIDHTIYTFSSPLTSSAYLVRHHGHDPLRLRLLLLVTFDTAALPHHRTTVHHAVSNPAFIPCIHFALHRKICVGVSSIQPPVSPQLHLHLTSQLVGWLLSFFDIVPVLPSPEDRLEPIGYFSRMRC